MKFLSLKPAFYAASIFLLLSSCKKEELKSPEMLENAELTSERSRIKLVPISGTYTTSNEVLGPPPMLLQRITGIGTSSHLGNSTFVAISTLNLTTAPPFNLAGTAVFTAANGDKFYTSFTGTAVPNPDGTRTVINDHTITGGTGRFDDATGTFRGVTIANLSSPTNSITYEGYISY